MKEQPECVVDEYGTKRWFLNGKYSFFDRAKQLFGESMTEQEARNLKVGDMVIFYDRGNKDIIKGHTFYFEVVNNKNIPADLGLIVEVNLDSDEVKIDWLSDVFHGGWCSMAALHDIKLA